MNQSKYYAEYLKRQRQARAESPELDMARKASMAMSAPFSQAIEDYKDTLNRKNIPTAVAQELSLQKSGEWASKIGQLYQEAEQGMAQRREQQQEKIEETEFKYEMAKEQEDEQKRNFLWKLIPQVAGTVFGGVAGLTGMFGAEKGIESALNLASAGAGAGSIISGLGTQDWNMVAEGIGDTLKGASNQKLSYDQKEMNLTLGKLTKHMESMGSSEDKLDFLGNVIQAYQTGNQSLLESLLPQEESPKTDLLETIQQRWGNYHEFS